MKRFAVAPSTVVVSSVVAFEATRFAATKRSKGAPAKKAASTAAPEPPTAPAKKPKKSFKVRRAWNFSEDGYAKSVDPDDVLATPEDAPIEDTMEYLEQVTRTGVADKHLREQMTMSMRMAAGECSPEVPSVSFLYALLRKNPSLMHETFARRVRIAVEEWNRLSEERRKTFIKHPLKGIVL